MRRPGSWKPLVILFVVGVSLIWLGDSRNTQSPVAPVAPKAPTSSCQDPTSREAQGSLPNGGAGSLFSPRQHGTKRCPWLSKCPFSAKGQGQECWARRTSGHYSVWSSSAGDFRPPGYFDPLDSGTLPRCCSPTLRPNCTASRTIQGKLAGSHQQETERQYEGQGGVAGRSSGLAWKVRSTPYGPDRPIAQHRHQARPGPDGSYWCASNGNYELGGRPSRPGPGCADESGAHLDPWTGNRGSAIGFPTQSLQHSAAGVPPSRFSSFWQYEAFDWCSHRIFQQSGQWNPHWARAGIFPGNTYGHFRARGPSQAQMEFPWSQDLATFQEPATRSQLVRGALESHQHGYDSRQTSPRTRPDRRGRVRLLLLDGTPLGRRPGSRSSSTASITDKIWSASSLARNYRSCLFHWSPATPPRTCNNAAKPSGTACQIYCSTTTVPRALARCSSNSRHF